MLLMSILQIQNIKDKNLINLCYSNPTVIIISLFTIFSFLLTLPVYEQSSHHRYGYIFFFG